VTSREEVMSIIGGLGRARSEPDTGRCTPTLGRDANGRRLITSVADDGGTRG
jgi:hypothetical protein